MAGEVKNKAQGSPQKRSAFLNLSPRKIVTGCPASPTQERDLNWKSMFAEQPGKVAQTASLFEEKENVKTLPASAFQKGKLDSALPKLPLQNREESTRTKRQTWGSQNEGKGKLMATNFVQQQSRPVTPINIKPDDPTVISNSMRSLFKPAEFSTRDKINKDFEVLLASLDVPTGIKEKMLCLDLATKEGMLLKSKPLDSPNKSPKKAPLLQKARSFASLRSSSPKLLEADIETQEGPDGFELITSISTRPSTPSTPIKARSRSNSTSSVPGGPSDNSPEAWAMLLRTSTHINLLPSHLIKLRMLLRNEKPEWIAQWIKCMGYRGLLERLNELINLEWREEQRDDALLYELLRCTKALTHSEVGNAALVSLFPNPHRPLIQLLYSEKKPGDVGPRQIIIELIQVLFTSLLSTSNYPPTISTDDWNTPVHYERWDLFSPMRNAYLPSARQLSSSKHIHQIIHSLMIGPPNDKEESLHSFVRHSHTPRPFKLWIAELTGVLSDGFWIFCHASNLIKDFTKIDLEAMSRPQVPQGHTGGVEFEFMAYTAAHLKLINSFVATADPSKAQQLHKEFFDSGLERALAALRKSNSLYYPQVHVELARYVYLARRAQYTLPLRIARHLETDQDKALDRSRPFHHKRSQTYLPEMQF